MAQISTRCFICLVPWISQEWKRRRDIGATIYDRKFRAFDSRDGELLWETELPFSGVATPSTYMVDGSQYVVIGASSARDPKAPQGGMYLAFALTK